MGARKVPENVQCRNEETCGKRVKGVDTARMVSHEAGGRDGALVLGLVGQRFVFPFVVHDTGEGLKG